MPRLCSLLERGLKPRLECNATTTTPWPSPDFWQAIPLVARVNYPGLASHPDHALAARQMRGFGGDAARRPLKCAPPGRVDAFLTRLRVVTPALSLGGVESLVCIPSRTSHRTLAPEERHRIGISDGLVRVSVGIEDVTDLQADLAQALGD